MKIINFIFDNFSDVFVVVCFAFSFCFAIWKKDISILENSAFLTVTEAEKKYGKGTGCLKLSYCIERLTAGLPFFVKAFLSSESVNRIIEKALEKAKKKWAENPLLITGEKEELPWQ